MLTKLRGIVQFAALLLIPALCHAAASPAQMLNEAEQRYEELEYDALLPMVEALLAREDLAIEQRLRAYYLKGAALAIIGDGVYAEAPFRMLLRGNPHFDLSGETPPKILAVFRKVQVEENAIREQLAQVRHEQLVATLSLEEVIPERATGGYPLSIAYNLTDPRGAVRRINLAYRKQHTPDYSSLALHRSLDGSWRGQLPGEWTSTESDAVLEYYVTTLDASNTELLHKGAPDAPMTLPIAAGTFEEARPFYETTWFWVIAGAAAVGLGAAGYLIVDNATELPGAEHSVRLPR